MRSYLNCQDLADSLVSAVQQLRKVQGQTGEAVLSIRSTRSISQWRVGDRLSEADTERLVAAFTAGTSKRKLAEFYGISESSVKRLHTGAWGVEGVEGISQASMAVFTGTGRRIYGRALQSGPAHSR